MKCHGSHPKQLSIVTSWPRGNTTHNLCRYTLFSYTFWITGVYFTVLKLFTSCLFVCFSEREFVNHIGSERGRVCEAWEVVYGPRGVWRWAAVITFSRACSTLFWQPRRSICPPHVAVAAPGWEGRGLVVGLWLPGAGQRMKNKSFSTSRQSGANKRLVSWSENKRYDSFKVSHTGCWSQHSCCLESTEVSHF